jgi:hypothetical protein
LISFRICAAEYACLACTRNTAIAASFKLDRQTHPVPLEASDLRIVEKVSAKTGVQANFQDQIGGMETSGWSTPPNHELNPDFGTDGRRSVSGKTI